MFQQKVLFAEHGAQPASRRPAHRPSPCSCLEQGFFGCLFVFPWLSAITMESMRAA